MKRIVIALLFPYFAPLVLLSIIFFTYLLATPYKPSDGTGPAGSDVLGLYLIGFSVIIGAAIQLALGLPLNLLVSRTRSLSLRVAACILAALVPSALYVPIMLDTSSSLIGGLLGFVIVFVTFGSGCWVVFGQLPRPTNTEQSAAG